MKSEWKTKITGADDKRIVVRGYALTELIGRLDFGEMFYLLVRGELPEPRVARMVNAMLVSCADHGIITPSVVARYVTASGSPLQAALAAGLLTIGDVYGGAVEQAAVFLRAALAERPGVDAEEIARRVVDDATARHARVPGFGHPLHPNGDPRAERLLALAEELGLERPHVNLARTIERALAKATGRTLPLNADGALGALVVDLGFDSSIARGFMLLARAAGTLAHACEELETGRPWRLPPPAEYELRKDEPYYEGVAPRSLPTDRTT
ncbi:MAG: citryl-CoA lyase [Candidatus Rokubacteria bacterium]|nr:citryl-CoA lyase [Candidatus Rokubacteria bacterium]